MSTIGKVFFFLIVILGSFAFAHTPTAQAYERLDISINQAGVTTILYDAPFASNSAFHSFANATSVTSETDYGTTTVNLGTFGNQDQNTQLQFFWGDPGTNAVCGGNHPNGSLECWQNEATYWVGFYWDDVAEVWSNMVASTSTFPQCSTCTRIIDIQVPEPEEIILATSTDVTVEYYVASNDVIDNQNIYIKYQYNSIKSQFVAQTEDTNYSGLIEDHVQFFDQSYFLLSRINNLTATGTYSVIISIVERVEPPWWQLWNYGTFTERELARQEYQFYAFQATDAIELANRIAERERQMIADANNCDINGELSIECIQQKFLSAVNTVLYAPPFGYATYLFSMLKSTTTATGTIAITHTIPNGMPGEGQSLTLDLTAGVSSSIAQIRNIDVDTIDGDPFDKFMYYWNLMWYIVLALWILHEVIGMKNLNAHDHKYD